jgi:DNA-binding GntR family transcriptional regulator
MAVFHLECSIHRRCASGLSVATEQLDAMTNAQAIAEAETRFVALLADRAGSAMLWDDTGQIIWSTRRFIPGVGNADAVASR